MAALKSLPVLSFNAFIIPILRIVCTISFTYFNATSLYTYDFSTLYTSLPHNLIKDKLIDLIQRTFNREGSPCLAVTTETHFLL